MPTPSLLSGTVVRRVALVALHRPRVVFIAWLLISVPLMLGAIRLTIDSSTSSFLDTNSPEWTVYQRSLAAHGGDEFVAVVLTAENALDRGVLERVRELHRSLEAIPGVRRVDSLASVPLIRQGLDGEVLLSGAIEDGVPAGPRLVDLVEKVRSDRIAPGALVSRDETSVALNVVLDEDVVGDRAPVVDEIRRLSGSAWVTGVPVFRTQINTDTLSQILTLVPLTCGLMALLFSLVLRSWVGVLLPLAIGGLGSGGSLGLMGWTGTTLSLSTMILPSILLALGSAYSMHVVAAATRHPSDSLEARLVQVAVPVALSGLTTALGFLAISTTRIGAIRELSIFGAFGVVVLTAASLTLAPAAISLSGLIERRAFASKINDWLAVRLAGLVVERRRSVFVGWAAVVVASIFGLSGTTISSDIIKWYPEDAPIRVEYARTKAALSGISPINVLVESNTGASTVTPEVLRAIHELGLELERRSDVGKALSLADPILMMRRALVGEETLPESREEIDQYLLLLESEEQLRDLVSSDHRSLNLVLRIDDNGSHAIAEVATAAEGWWEENGPKGFSAEATGVMYEFAREQDAIAETQISSLALALLGMGGVLWWVVGSFRSAMLCLLPNVAPLAVAYGGMGFLGLPIDAATACLGSLALGIAVDDTVHVALSLESQPRPTADGLRVALSRVLFPLALSSLAIALGFGALAISDFVLVRNLGVLTAVVVSVCWLADVTLLPCLIARHDP